MKQLNLLSILLLSEDSSKDGVNVLHEIIKKILFLIDPQVNLEAIKFEPLPSLERNAQLAVWGNVWKSKQQKDQPKKIALRRAIATFLCRQNACVCFHFDADRIFSNFPESENVKMFAIEIEHPVSLLVRGMLERHPERSSLELFMTGLLRIVPCYSIESWLYQNISVAIRIISKTYHGKDLDLMKNWETDRGLLDELEQPKNSCILHSKHNFELASESFPSRKLYEVGKSFTQTVENLRTSQRLTECLQNIKTSF